ncbi:MAG: hypothetical protein FJW20_16445 [Acidimicrobiia bacterium]|nr:hypothetical protein [Acidimicrobiia bacterium]
MKSRAKRALILVSACLLVFFSVALILTRIIPGPHGQKDYLVIGTLATFASLVVLFVVLLTTYIKDPTVFFKRRKS